MSLCSRFRSTLGFVLALGLLITAPAITRGADVTIDAATTYQTIEGFGTCLAWWVNDPGNSVYYNPTFRNLYVKDLGFNILRVEMHPSVLMGPGGTLASPVDLADDVATNVPKFNMARREAAVYGDLAAYLHANVLEPGTDKVVGAFWTPPHWLKGPTGTVFWTGDAAPWAQGDGNTAGGRLKQDANSKTQFARYAAAWIRAFEQKYGVKFAGVSLQNELLWETAYNSATYWKNETGTVDQFWQYAEALRTVGDYFRAKGMTAKIMGPHHANIAGSPANPWHMGIQMGFINAIRNHASGNLMQNLGIIASNDYVDEGMVNHAAMLHGYWNGKAATSVPWASVADGNVSQYGKQNWFQETSGEGATWDKDNALGLALRYHDALVQGHASAYIYWQTADGAADVNGNILLGTNQLSNPTSSKKYCAVKHFSRLIRPGAHRVRAVFDQNGWSSYGGSHQDDTYNSLNVSAFVKGNTLAVVLVNMRGNAEPTSIKIPASLGIAQMSAWRTSAGESFAAQPALAVSGGKVALSVPALSVVTLYGYGPGGGGGGTTATLTITKNGTGGGVVSSSPAGINCGSACRATVSSGASYKLTATAAAGSTFAGWSGACAGYGACTVSMAAARTATATFHRLNAATALKRDFDGNGRPDLVWHNQSTGQLALWYMNGLSRTGTAAIWPSVTDTNWQIRGIADFNGDLRPDLLWRNQQTGQVQVWYMNGTTRVGVAALPSVQDANWQIRAVADFNRDGKPDLLWQHQTTGQLTVWHMNGVTLVSNVPLSPARVSDMAWRIVAAADLNGDGRPDLIWQNSNTGQTNVWYMNDRTCIGLAAIYPTVADTGWRIRQVADFNGDGRPDLQWQHQTTGQLSVWYMNGVKRVGVAALTPNAVSDTAWQLVTR